MDHLNDTQAKYKIPSGSRAGPDQGRGKFVVNFLYLSVITYVFCGDPSVVPNYTEIVRNSVKQTEIE